jgi:Zn-dependent membrane protease YugP
MMLFDPLYLVIMIVGFLLSAGASGWVKLRMNKWGDVQTSRGMTGRQVAESILRAKGIQDVNIEKVDGFLSDHYDPSSKTLRLSSEIHDGETVASAGIAAHEVGHAIQHADGYLPMKLRQKMVPVANIGTNLGVWIIIGGMVIGALGLAKLGVFLFGGAVAFTLVTLPVEFDASFRAKDLLDNHNLVDKSELEGVEEILTAAAATYVAAAVTSIMQLLYFMMRTGMLGGRE